MQSKLKSNGFVFRNKHESNYTCISNEIFKRTDISDSAAMLLCRVLSLPDNWVYTREGLAKISYGGITTITSALRELREKGYLEIKKEHINGRYQYLYYFYENSIMGSGTELECRKPEEIQTEIDERKEEKEIKEKEDIEQKIKAKRPKVTGISMAEWQNMQRLSKVDKKETEINKKAKEEKQRLKAEKQANYKFSSLQKKLNDYSTTQFDDKDLLISLSRYVSNYIEVFGKMGTESWKNKIDLLKTKSDNNLKVMLDIVERSITKNWKDFYGNEEQEKRVLREIQEVKQLTPAEIEESELAKDENGELITF